MEIYRSAAYSNLEELKNRLYNIPGQAIYEPILCYTRELRWIIINFVQNWQPGDREALKELYSATLVRLKVMERDKAVQCSKEQREHLDSLEVFLHEMIYLYSD